MRRATIYILAAVLALLTAACASIGRPEGGPRDEEPPRFVRSNPAPGQLNVKGRSFTLTFDENVQLEDAFNKVIVSPVQKEAPQVSANGRTVRVNLRDTLLPDMTYTIDFGDAVKDLNEGNVLDGFALDFSTGDRIDSLRVAGRVLKASNLEPAQGILVAAYSNLADTAVRTLPPDRIARTNQYGTFTLRNLADTVYRIYAIDDVNRDNHWDRSEDIAFLDTFIRPYVEDITVTDTLYDSNRGDSIIERPGRRFMPNDLLLTTFNLGYRAQYLKNYSRVDQRRVLLTLGAPTDSLPQVRPVGTAMDGRDFTAWAVPEINRYNDSIVLWLADPEVLATDSLSLSVRYQRPDSLERLQWRTDTLRFFYRRPKLSKKELEAAERDTLPPRKDLLGISVASTRQEFYQPMQLKFTAPVATIDTAAIHLDIKVDTLWQPVALPPLVPDTANPVLGRTLDVKWEPGAAYRLRIDSAAVTDIYGEHNPPVNSNITVRAVEEYCTLTFRLKGADTTAIVQLLSASDAVTRQERVGADGTVTFRWLDPGNVYARVFFDADGNGLYSTGVVDSIQPEEVAYYPKKIQLKRNWDIAQDWDIYELPVDRQKPYAILKNKPKLRRGEKAPEEEQPEDEDPMLGGGTAGNRTEHRGHNTVSRPTGGGFRQNNNATGTR